MGHPVYICFLRLFKLLSTFFFSFILLGRPQFDNSGIACVMVQENKKNFYRKFLFEPFPVESNLLEFLPDHVNAEVYNGNITNKVQLMDFIQSTFFYRRLLRNPSYYQMNSNSTPDQYVDELAESVINTLREHDCVVTEKNVSIFDEKRTSQNVYMCYIIKI